MNTNAIMSLHIVTLTNLVTFQVRLETTEVITTFNYAQDIEFTAIFQMR
jgi:hypothetical protein